MRVERILLSRLIKWNHGDYFRLRRLTPREWFRFMSVEEKDIDRLVSTGVSESQLYKQGGNAIVIKTMRYLYTSIFDDVSEWYRC